ncbi:translation initiation factor IF-2-like [Molothrus ater]|uniref:translation initiation factor IF-2-like n=1 Tax=Molothrus ater TaxID=84834 RepID=UPI001749D397|nr:translation initiation factor IF-2-like [Molothrus ater]
MKGFINTEYYTTNNVKTMNVEIPEDKNFFPPGSPERPPRGLSGPGRAAPASPGQQREGGAGRAQRPRPWPPWRRDPARGLPGSRGTASPPGAGRTERAQLREPNWKKAAPRSAGASFLRGVSHSVPHSNGTSEAALSTCGAGAGLWRQPAVPAVPGAAASLAADGRRDTPGGRHRHRDRLLGAGRSLLARAAPPLARRTEVALCKVQYTTLQAIMLTYCFFAC